jgi:micrococcal nuclease
VLVALVLVVGSAIVPLPWIGPRALALARWRSIPFLGTLTGITAAASIFGIGIGVSVLGATVAPLPNPSPTVASSTTPPPPSTPTTRATIAPRGTTAITDQPAASQERIRAQVLSVTDGDTIRVLIDGVSVAIRYIGIDTPETVDPRTGVECFGREASAFNRELVEGKTVELEKDVSELDRFGRTLRYVWMERGSQLVMVNEELVSSGYATSSTYPPDVKYQQRFGRAEAAARSAGLGLWGDVCAAANSTPGVAPTQPPVPTVAPAFPFAPSAGPRTLSPASAAPTTAQATAAPRSAAPTAAPPTAAPTTRTNCHASYPTVCIPPAPPDLDCGDVPYRRFTVLPPDPHGFDGNNNGIGCES